MELYFPYMISSGLFMISTHMGYNYLYTTQKTEDIETNIEDTDDYEILNSKIEGDYEVCMKKIIEICEKECNYSIRIKKTRRFKGKILKYIDEYNTMGHTEFIKMHIKKSI